MTITLTNSKDNYDYIIKGIQSWDDGKEETSMKFNLPDGAPSDVSIIRLEGQREDIPISFYLFTRTDDSSNGTANGIGSFTTIKTVAEQEEWIQDYIFTKDFDASWTLTDGERFSSENITINNVRISRVVGAPNLRLVRMSVTLGTNLLA